jgi:ribosome-associated protein
VIEVGEVIPITDFFVLVTCSNRRHVDTLSQEVLKALKEKISGNPRVEGRGAGWWVLLDAGIVVVHLFEERARDFYDLDNLWADAREIDWKK